MSGAKASDPRPRPKQSAISTQLAETIIVYKCADRSYDFNFVPDFTSSNKFIPRCVWLSHDGCTSAPGWTGHSIDVGTGPAAGKDFNRFCKFLPEDILPACAASIYVDGNVAIAPGATAEVEAFLASGADIALMTHAQGRTIADEIAACSLSGKLSSSAEALAWRNLERYTQEGFPPESPVFYGGVLMRRHGRTRLARAMQDWAKEYADGITRDQISLPYVLWRNGVSVHPMTCSYADPEGPFVAHRHKQGRWLSDLNQKRKNWMSARQRGKA